MSRELPSGGIFLSHCREDHAVVAELERALSDAGYALYVDIDSHRGRDTLARTIARFLNAASRVVVVLSKVAIRSRRVQTEIEWSLSREISDRVDLVVPWCTDAEALGWVRRDGRLAERQVIQAFDRPLEAAIWELLESMPEPRDAKGGARSVEDRLTEEEESALPIVEEIAESSVLHLEGRDREALALATGAAKEARRAGFSPELSRARESRKRILDSGDETLVDLDDPSALGPGHVLEVMTGERAGKVFALEAGREYRLGRAAACEIRLPGLKVSGTHCKVIVEPAGVRVEDLGSSNGTFVDGRRVERAPLEPESLLRAGDVELRLVRKTEEAPADDRGVSGGFPRVRLSGLPAEGRCAVCAKAIDRQAFRDHDALFTSEAQYCIECFAEADLPQFPEYGIFRILKRLAEGGMGEVFEAVQKTMLRSVAFKVLKTIAAPDPEALKRFFREARVGARLNHPNIVQFIDAGQIGSKCFLAMEFVEGESLGERLTVGKLPVRESLRIGYHVAKALAHAAEKNIVHRDVKPGNILLRYDGVVKLGDFGLAKNFRRAGLSDLTLDGQGMGTLRYMPPENLDDAVHADPRGDVYSLGVTLYECLSGVRPFDAAATPALIAQIIRHHPALLSRIDPSIPEEVSRLVEKAIAKVPEDRHAGPAEFMNLLGKAYHAAKKGTSSR